VRCMIEKGVSQLLEVGHGSIIACVITEYGTGASKYSKYSGTNVQYEVVFCIHHKNARMPRMTRKIPFTSTWKIFM
jgi:hypothetical protein